MSSLVEWAGLSYLFPHSICYDMLFWSKHKENLASNSCMRISSEKKKCRNVLIAFSDNYRYFSLILHWNSVSNNLNVGCNVESETISSNSLYSVTLKSTASLHFECIFYQLGQSILVSNANSSGSIKC